MNFVEVEMATGGIRSHGNCGSLSEVPVRPGHMVWDVSDLPEEISSAIHYWDGQAYVPMLRLEDVIIASGPLFTNIPPGTVVQGTGKARGIEVTVMDGELDYVSDIEGVHTFTFIHPSHIIWRDHKVML